MVKGIRILTYVALMGLAFMGFMKVNGMPLSYLWDSVSVAFVVAGWLYIFVNFSLTEVVQAFAQGFGFLPSAQPLLLSHQILGQLGKNGLLAGGISMLLGVFQSLANLEEIAALGAALALSLLPLIWALGIYTVFLQPLQSALMRQHLSTEEF